MQEITVKNIFRWWAFPYLGDERFRNQINKSVFPYSGLNSVTNTEEYGGCTGLLVWCTTDAVRIWSPRSVNYYESHGTRLQSSPSTTSTGMYWRWLTQQSSLEWLSTSTVHGRNTSARQPRRPTTLVPSSRGISVDHRHRLRNGPGFTSNAQQWGKLWRSNSGFAQNVLSRTVCPPYNAVVGYHDAEPRCNWGVLYQCVVVFATKGTTVNEHVHGSEYQWWRPHMHACTYV